MPPMPAVDFDEGDELRTVGTLRPLASSAVSLEEEEASKFCGVEGQVYVHQPEATPSTSTAPGLDTGASSVPSEGGGQSSKGKYYIHTFGCQMNAADSERMAGCLEAEGYSNVTDPDAADVLIYNTCSIRDHAEKKVYSYIGKQAKRKRQQPDLKLVVAGCVGQQEGEALLRRVPELDLVMGPQHANRINHLLDDVDLGSQVCATEEVYIEEDISRPRRESNVTAWVNVIYGCNEHCTYCVVPTTRGSEQSRTPEMIKREITACAEAGYKEITLLGQNIDAYGRDLPGVASDASGRRAWTFTDLLRYIHDVDGIERIRFATSHPRYFSKRLIKACYELPKVCEHFHIPVQAGNNRVLKEMKRGYTHERYRKIIDDIRTLMPDAAISTDFIVGFPGEEEYEFEQTLQLAQDIQFDNCMTAAYSPRPNTPAALWENQVADLVKQDRLNRLNDLVRECATSRSQRYLDRIEEVLVEGENPRHPEQVKARTRQNRIVFFDGDAKQLTGKLVNVHVKKTQAYSLFGELV